MPASEERAGFTPPLAPSPEATGFLAQLLASAPALLTIDTLPHHRQIRAVAYQPRIDRALVRYPSRCTRSVRSGVECVEVESEKGAQAGTLVYCYGGGFVCGFPEQDMPIIAALACFTGMRIVVPHYRLAPEHPWPAALDDVCRVFQDLSRTHPRGSLALVGESAGGNLALALVQRLTGQGMDLPRVVGLMSPWSDIRPEHAFGGLGDGVDPTLRVQNLHQTARMYAGSCPTSHPELSPQFGNFQATFPPTLITTGTRDLLQDSCKSLALRMRAAGVAVEIDVWPDLWHVFEYYDEIPEAELSLQRMARFLVRAHPALPS